MIESLFKRYDLDKLAVATIASHTALQLLRGAKRRGFRTIAVARPGSAWFYKRFAFIDEVWEAEFKNFKLVAERLAAESAVLIPHGSYVEYVGWRQALEAPVLTLGVRQLIEIEADQHKKMALLRRAGIPIPRSFKAPEEVDAPVIVKLPGAKGGRGYFLARDREELAAKLKALAEGEQYIIQEYIFGVPAYYHYFASPIYGRVEIFGMDLRYESNVDGRTFGLAEPTFVVVGNLPLVLRESLLPVVAKYGEAFAEAVGEATGVSMRGPYSLESIIRDDASIVVFEFSGRIVAGTNVYLGVGSQYSALYFDEPMDMGERIAHELDEARKRGKLDELVS